MKITFICSLFAVLTILNYSSTCLETQTTIKLLESKRASNEYITYDNIGAGVKNRGKSNPREVLEDQVEWQKSTSRE